MRAPEFWARPGAAAALLAPLGWAWGALANARLAVARPWRAPLKVLCVGNLVAGGAGKTPVALSIGARLAARGAAVHYLTRGYGGSARGPLRVDAPTHTAADVGDEALLLARVAPTWVARRRAAGARAAAAAGAQVLVMDDGFQNPALVKDVALLVVDGEYGFGNERVMPAGPLREPISGGLARADAVCVVGADTAGVARRVRRAPGDAIPVLGARFEPGPETQRLAGRPVVAFAGIGRPAKFFASLAEIGCRAIAAHAFPDHYAYRPADIERLRRQAAKAGALAVTTAKDFERIPAPSRAGIEVLTIGVRWADEAALDAILERLMGNGG